MAAQGGAINLSAPRIAGSDATIQRTNVLLLEFTGQVVLIRRGRSAHDRGVIDETNAETHLDESGFASTAIADYTRCAVDKGLVVR